ncbi:hypothetical protein [Bradyrhizobium mercantei]|uniref:hypothetical protein n=1 Tax=Bradyrhizobium mercantei TaxID=1904807 RepID=UPI001177DC9E|nr:hypothetical protein [Bradyrhizobium mercantei]
MTRELNIRLFRRGRSSDGIDGYWQVGYDFTLSDFGGVLPNVGDMIAPSIEGAREIEKHKVYTVESRFFRPAGSPHQFINVGLVVSERNASKEEEHLIVGGG